MPKDITMSLKGERLNKHLIVSTANVKLFIYLFNGMNEYMWLLEIFNSFYKKTNKFFATMTFWIFGNSKQISYFELCYQLDSIFFPRFFFLYLSLILTFCFLHLASTKQWTKQCLSRYIVDKESLTCYRFPKNLYKRR